MLKAKWVLSIGGIAVLVAIGLLWLTGTLSFQREPPSVQPSTTKPVPPEFATGETLFKTPLLRMPWASSHWHRPGAIVSLEGLRTEPS